MKKQIVILTMLCITGTIRTDSGFGSGFAGGVFGGMTSSMLVNAVNRPRETVYVGKNPDINLYNSSPKMKRALKALGSSVYDLEQEVDHLRNILKKVAEAMEKMENVIIEQSKQIKNISEKMNIPSATKEEKVKDLTEKAKSPSKNNKKKQKKEEPESWSRWIKEHI